MTTLANIWTDDNKLRAIFSWLTRIGAAPKFGTLPIAYYQADQCKAIDALKACLKAHNLPEFSRLKLSGGCIYAQAEPRQAWVRIAMLVCGEIVAR